MSKLNFTYGFKDSKVENKKDLPFMADLFL